MKVLIYTNPTRDIGSAITSRVTDFLQRCGVDTEVYSSVGDFAWDCEVIIAIGGDGTILRAASISGGRPILGINAGSVGFMSAFDANECEERLGEVLDGRYVVNEHMLLDVSVMRGGENLLRATVLNDAVVTGRHVAKTVTLEFLNDGRYMARVRGDGLIAATPTGSTAYSMSAGGPVVDPALEAIILTPVCAHNVSAPSFVLASSSVACIRCISPEGSLILDGVPGCALAAGDEVVLRKSDKTCRLVRLQKYSFYDIINKKLFDGR